MSTLAGDGRYAFTDGAGASASFKYPVGVSWSPDGTQIVVADFYNQRLRLIQVGTGVVSTLAGNGFARFRDGAGASASFKYPIGVSWSPNGTQIAVADR